MSMIDDPRIDGLSRFLDVNAARTKMIASNIANVDTPGYQTRDLDFRAELSRADAEAGGDGEWDGPGAALHYASYSSAPHPSASYAPVSYAALSRPVRGLIERPDGNNVSVERESLLLAETQMKYGLGVQLLKSAFHGISQAINSGGTSS